MSKFHLFIICILSLTVAACSGGGGGGGGSGGSGTVTGTSSSYSSDGATKTIITNYSDGTSSQQTLTGTPSDPEYSGSQLSYKYSFSDGSKSPTQTLNISKKSSESYSVDGTTKTVTYTLGNGKQVSFTLPGTAGTATYKTDGSEKYISYSYLDSTSYNATLTGTLTTPKYSADFLQKTLVYSFSDGTTHDGGTINGHADTPQFSEDGSQKTPVYRYDDGTQYFGTTLNGTPATPVYSSDGSQKTLRYSFSDGTINNGAILTGTKTNPLSDAAVYPSDWTTTGSVTAPVTHALFYSFSDQTTYTVEDGTKAKPFSQSNLTPNGAAATGAINDPNAYVNAPTKGTYDLRWGTPDPAGPGYAAYFKNNKSYTLPTSKKIFDAVLSGGLGGAFASATDSHCGATLPAPSPEVIDAWNHGWTGKGQNILIWDDINDQPISAHPATVETIAQRYAWGSNFYGMTYRVTNPDVLNLDGTISNSTSKISIDVINMSYGANLDGYFNTHPQYIPYSIAGLLAARSYYQAGYSDRATLLTKDNYQGPNNGNGGFDLSGAVLVKAAGNDSIDAQYEPLNYWLAQNTSDITRLLIVGALTDIGTPTARVALASYSNKAGSDPTIQSRFLVESGRSVFSSSLNDYYDGQPLTSGEGTSYAAPRVAGYVAIVRQKFTNLTAANTADIMLATARYDTLLCYSSGSGPTGGCDKATYGQGEASLSRALAPVGYLR